MERKRLIYTLVSRPYEASLSVSVLHHPLSPLALPLQNSLGAVRDRGSDDLLWAQWMCEYDPVVRSFQYQSDLNLL